MHHLLPDLTRLVGHVASIGSGEFSPEHGRECENADVDSAQLTREFILRYFLRLLSFADSSDEVGRRSLVHLLSRHKQAIRVYAIDFYVHCICTCHPCLCIFLCRDLSCSA